MLDFVGGGFLRAAFSGELSLDAAERQRYMMPRNELLPAVFFIGTTCMERTHGRPRWRHMGSRIGRTLCWLTIVLLTQTVLAQDLDSAARALDLITRTASSICNDIKSAGAGNKLELSGTAKAEVSRLIRQLADLKVDGAAKYQFSSYENVLQADLAKALSDSATCKQKIYQDLSEKLLPRRARPPSAEVLKPTEIYMYAAGSFRKTGRQWTEYLANVPGTTFTFQERSRDSKYIYLVDSSRLWDGKADLPLSVRLPIGGGMSHLRYGERGTWNDLYYVEPM